MKALYSISYKVKNDTEMEITQKIFGGWAAKRPAPSPTVWKGILSLWTA